MMNQIFRFIETLLMPGALVALAKWKPFSVTSFRMVCQLKEIGINFNTVIDGGANVGQFARAALETFPDARVISFEAIPEIADQLKKNVPTGNRFRIVQSALGNKNGRVKFHVNYHSHSSSVLPLHENHKAAFPSALEKVEINVPVITLDSALKNERLLMPVLLKLDLQGYELEALKGASKTLSRVEAVLLEVSLKRMYQGEPTFNEIRKYLEKKGFRFLKALDHLKDKRGNPLQMDALFTKR